MATLHTEGDHIWVAVKGALEALGPLLDPADAETRESAEQVARQYAADGYRVLAFAERSLADVPARLDDAENWLRLVGIVGMADPPRAASGPSIAACAPPGSLP